jgi:hypothetical protein
MNPTDDSIMRRTRAHGVPLLLLLLQACSSTPPEPIAENEAHAVTSEAKPSSDRRVFEGCAPAEEVERYESLAGEAVLITFAWKDMKNPAANLKVPARVIRIDSPDVIVGFDPRVPNLDLYTSVWSYSGHIKGRSDGTFGVDPCSATMEKGSW